MKLKKFINIFYFLGFIFIYSFILSILNLLFCFNNSIFKILILLGMGLFMMVFGIKKSKFIKNKILFNGIKYGSGYILILFLMGLVCGKLCLSKFIYYIILLVCYILGILIGNTKKTST